MRVEIVPHLAQPLALGEQYYQPVDRGRERSSTVRPRSLPEQRDYLRILGEEFELRGQREPEPFQRSTGRVRESTERRFQVAGGLGQHCLEKAALGVVVVEQQLLVDACPSRDLIYARARANSESY